MIDNLISKILIIGSLAIAACGSILILGLIIWGFIRIYIAAFAELISLCKFKKEFINFLLQKSYFHPKQKKFKIDKE